MAVNRVKKQGRKPERRARQRRLQHERRVSSKRCPKSRSVLRRNGRTLLDATRWLQPRRVDVSVSVPGACSRRRSRRSLLQTAPSVVGAASTVLNRYCAAERRAIDMSSKRHIRRSKCERKIKYRSAGEARRAAKVIAGRFNDHMVPYPCEFGSHFHLGHEPGRIQFAKAAKQAAHKARKRIDSAA